MGSLETRVRRLEDASGSGDCPRCSRSTMVYVNEVLESVTKGGRKFTPEEAEAFESEEEGGRCPVCGQGRPEIVIGGWGADPPGSKIK